MMLFLLACTAKPVENTSVACDACGGDCVDESATPTDWNHVDGDIVYPDAPPTSGDHNGCWTDWGVHATDPGDEHWVHNLEHGGVVFLYNPAECPPIADTGQVSDWVPCDDEVAALEAVLATGADPRWIIAPYDDLPTAWAAVSWGRRQMLGCFDVPTMQALFTERVGGGREEVTSAPPASCEDTE